MYTGKKIINKETREYIILAYCFMNNSVSEAKQFKRNKWIYGTSGTGRDMAYSLFSNYLLTYVMFTRSLTAEQFAVIGIILAVFRVWDAINDPVMGGIIENTRSRFGKFKPWIIIGAITNAVVLVIMFTNRASGWGFVALFAGLYLIWDITWTMNDIGYWSMLPSLTSEPRQRDGITSLANLFAGIGAILAIGLIPMLTNGDSAIGGNSVTGYAAVAITIAVILSLSQTFVFFGIKLKEKVAADNDEHVGLKKMFKVISGNKQLLWVTLIMMLYNLGSTLLNAFGVFYMYLSFGYNGFLVTLFVGSYAIANVGVNALYPAIAKRLTRRKMSTIAVCVAVFGYLLFFVMETLLSGSPDALRLGCMYFSAFLIGFGQSLFYMVTTVCLANTIEYNEHMTGTRDEAIIFSLRPFMAKFASALQQALIVAVYALIGMRALTNSISDIEQQANMSLITEAAKNSQISEILSSADPSMAFWLRFCMAVLPIILIGAAYLVMRGKYKIDEEKYNLILDELKEKREQMKS